MKKYILLIISAFLLFSCSENVNIGRTGVEKETGVFAAIYLDGTNGTVFEGNIEIPDDLRNISFPKNGSRNPSFHLAFSEPLPSDKEIVDFIKTAANFVTKDYSIVIGIKGKDVQEVLNSEIIFDAISKMKVKKIAFVSSEKSGDKTEKEYTIPQNIVQKILNTEVEKTYDISTSYNPIYFLDEKGEKKSLIYQNGKAKYFTNQNNSRLFLNKLLDKEEKKAYELQTWGKIFSKD
ncbi:hypothetical protein BLD25_01500 [Candidatus Gracilibacteria bacterium GN02-872]|nr:hypothetical protein BLD25_01500 [Candidatus Gracilibacteria bacterium GN02-872]